MGDRTDVFLLLGRVRFKGQMLNKRNLNNLQQLKQYHQGVQGEVNFDSRIMADFSEEVTFALGANRSAIKRRDKILQGEKSYAKTLG